MINSYTEDRIQHLDAASVKTGASERTWQKYARIFSMLHSSADWLDMSSNKLHTDRLK